MMKNLKMIFIVPFAIIACGLICILTGCNQEGGVSTTQSASSNDSEIIVKGQDGNDLILSHRGWSEKYPFMIEGLNNNSDGWRVISIPSENLIVQGEAITTKTPEGNSITVSVVDAQISDQTAFSTAELEEAFSRWGEPKENETYLVVTLNLENNTEITTEIYLNNCRVYVCVNNEVGTGKGISEAISLTPTQHPGDPKDLFKYVLQPGESQKVSILYYANRNFELNDLYLSPNFQGSNEFGAGESNDIVVQHQWLAID